MFNLKAQASQKLWLALVAADQYIARGLAEQLSSSDSFGGSDMKPVIAAYTALRETEPFLPEDVVRAAEVALEVVERELNCFLDVLGRAISSPLEHRETAIQELDDQRQTALRVFRRELNCVKQKLPSLEETMSNRVINFGQIGAIGTNARVEGNSFEYSLAKTVLSVELPELALELSKLRTELRKIAVEIEHDQAVANIASAEVAAQHNDRESTFKYLKAAGKWALDAATKIGVQVAAKALEAAIKLP